VTTGYITGGTKLSIVKAEIPKVLTGRGGRTRAGEPTSRGLYGAAGSADRGRLADRCEDGLVSDRPPEELPSRPLPEPLR
jgi:hypothetical protein